jgi:predicted transcriptional regulator
MIGEETIDNASVLALKIGNQLGFNLSNPASPAVSTFNPSGLHNVDTHNDTSLGGSVFLYGIDKRRDQWYKGLNFEGSNASHLSLCYENKSQKHNLFTAFILEINQSKISAPNYTEKESTARNFSLNLGLPVDNLTIELINWSSKTIIPTGNGNITTWLNETIVRYTHQRQVGYFLDGCNQISFLFNRSGFLIEIESLPFISMISQPLFKISADEALSIGRRNAILVENNQIGQGMEYTFQGHEIYGLRLVINGTVNQYALAYGYLAYFRGIPDNSFHLTEVSYIDVDSGSVISYFFIGGIEYHQHVPVDSTSQWYILFVSGGLVLLAFGILIGPPDFSIAFFWILVAPLYIRAKGLDALENFNRGRLYEYVKAHPGQSYSTLKKELHLKNGNLSYHLVILEKFHLIKSTREENKKLFFTISNSPIIDARSLTLSRTGNLILSEIRKKEYLTASMLSATLGMTRQRIHYHLRNLEKKGLIESIGDGWRYLGTDELNRTDQDEH